MTPTIKEKTIEIAQRTRKNLEFIYQAKEHGENVEEFTQLLNSMLGMLISLSEDYFKGSTISWDDVERLGLKSWDPKLKQINGKMPTAESPKLKQLKSFSELITKLRNAFAHNNFDHTINGEKTLITGVKVWNIPLGKKGTPENRVWEAEISEKDLKSLAYLFVEYLEKELDS